MSNRSLPVTAAIAAGFLFIGACSSEPPPEEGPRRRRAGAAPAPAASSPDGTGAHGDGSR